ncbi:hypothetical protein [Cryobacterium sp. PH31-L1]|nr:hypothetical protein [Cryobacterium sp. PH31-L1]MDJ0376557.1 hypothetical protein [Cryobacterium sp. PH31-L1]
MMRRAADLVAVISPSAIDLPATKSVDITDWVGADDGRSGANLDPNRA